jgi:FAD/FMN-containing dehydrogenase
VFATGAVFDAASRVAVEEHLDRMQRELAPYSTGGRALNFAERPGDVSAAFRPEAWKRLQAVKARYDPDGLFVAAHQVR